MPGESKDSLEEFLKLRETEVKDYERRLDEAYRTANRDKEFRKLERTSDTLGKVKRSLDKSLGLQPSDHPEQLRELPQPPPETGKVVKGRAGVETPALPLPNYANPPKSRVVVDPRNPDKLETLIHERMHRTESLPLAQDYGPGGRIPGLTKEPERPRRLQDVQPYLDQLKRFHDEARLQKALNYPGEVDLPLLDAVRMNRSLSDQHATQKAYQGYEEPPEALLTALREWAPKGAGRR